MRYWISVSGDRKSLYKSAALPRRRLILSEAVLRNTWTQTTRPKRQLFSESAIESGGQIRSFR
jgi:hypothetical protein